MCMEAEAHQCLAWRGDTGGECAHPGLTPVSARACKGMHERADLGTTSVDVSGQLHRLRPVSLDCTSRTKRWLSKEHAFGLLRVRAATVAPAPAPAPLNQPPGGEASVNFAGQKPSGQCTPNPLSHD